MSTHLPATLPPPWGDSAIPLFLRPLFLLSSWSPRFPFIRLSFSLQSHACSRMPTGLSCLARLPRWSLPYFGSLIRRCSPLVASCLLAFSLSASPSAGVVQSFFQPACRSLITLPCFVPALCLLVLRFSHFFSLLFRLTSGRGRSFHMCIPLHYCLLSSSLFPEQQGHGRFGMTMSSLNPPRCNLGSG